MVGTYKEKGENLTNHEDIQATLALVQEKGYSMKNAAKKKGASRETQCR